MRMGQLLKIKKNTESRMDETNAAATPINCEEIDLDVLVSSKVPYHEAVECFMYFTTASDPDIVFAINKVIDKPTVRDLNEVKF